LETRQLNDKAKQVKHRRSNRTQGRIKMLVLSRKVGEKLVIDGNITVEVVKVQGNRITLGIAAPSDVKVLRGELAKPKANVQTAELVVQDGLLLA
jgi:carbon storage regulator